ncbi:DUF423 domain-containing protein [Parvularcula sp. ZS-1/3]|uniref:DUF423 domain-containing protein n=1 Tax=Parvularcula mediterranea TaxID=2732508 RepID=A0A7Y3RKR5_9PROT|nr:DUF423 domain-containing protein [Parvularcula mediterranea]NNU15873.1 DUF423 domain-containing protein [Parvularcula mediterranea]
MKLTACAAILGFSAVALGAFGAHGLENRLSAEAQGWWETASFYLLVHAALGAAMAGQGRRWRWAVVLLLGGAALFAATLYAMALGAPRVLGAVTPLGGLGMLAGWALFALQALRGHGAGLKPGGKRLR